MANAEYKRFTCTHCKLDFEATKEKRYCTRKCNQAAIRKNKTSVSRAEYVAKTRENAASKFTCECCGIEAFRTMSGTNKAKGFVNRWCSMICRSAAAAQAEARQSTVAKEIAALKRIARHVERAMMFRCHCVHCGSEMIVRRNGGLHKKVCDACSAEKIRLARRVSKLKRRASHRTADSDSINPIRVFERDRWRCHICGVLTLQKLRGTYHDRAPELEHIVSLADGGSHTWGNVACSCRKCNQAKGQASFGQLGLRFAA